MMNIWNELNTYVGSGDAASLQSLLHRIESSNSNIINEHQAGSSMVPVDEQETHRKQICDIAAILNRRNQLGYTLVK